VYEDQKGAADHMTRIRIDTQKAMYIARQLIAQGDRLSEIGHELQHATESLDTGTWDGHSRHQAEPLLDRVRPESAYVTEALDRLGRKLLHVAKVFEQEDNTAAHNLDGMPWVDFETADGQVLGEATVAGMAAPTAVFASLQIPADGQRVRDIANMSWADRFDYADELPQQIGALKQEYLNVRRLISQCDQDIDGLDQRIQDLQEQRRLLQQEADRGINKIRRSTKDGSGLFRFKKGFDDDFPDAPWRTISDDKEDQIDDLDQQIIELQDQRQELVESRRQHRQDLDAVVQQLESKQHDLDEVNRVLGEGIPKDGPSDYYAYFPDHNCTKYAASKRDVPCRGHAYKWNNEAGNSGYEVGKRPVSGSVMVWEREFKGADSDYGHVAIVENVTVQDDGSYKVWYTDNNNTDGNNPASIVLDPDMQNVSFIYEKLPTS
jgi:surface antigen/uncharacterized protein YukE